MDNPLGDLGRWLFRAYATPPGIRTSPLSFARRKVGRESQLRGRKPPVVLDGASSGLWFDGWKGRSPPPFGRYADQHRRCEVAEPRTWLLEKGWRRIGLVDPAEVPGSWPLRRAARA